MAPRGLNVVDVLLGHNVGCDDPVLHVDLGPRVVLTKHPAIIERLMVNGNKMLFSALIINFYCFEGWAEKTLGGR